MTGRVVVFNNNISPYTNRVYNSLKQQGVDIRVISCTMEEPNRSWAHSIKAKYPHCILPGLTLRLSDSRYAHINRRIVRTLKENKPELLIVNGFYPSMLIAGAWASLSKTPLALAIDGWSHTMPRSIYHRVARPWLLHKCIGIIVCGAKGREYFRQQGFQESTIFTVPLIPAWDIPTILPSFSERPFHLLWVAHMNDSVKNVRFFMDVVRAANARIANLNIRLVGRGPAADRVLAELDQAAISYKYNPIVETALMPNIFASARVLLLPSLWEPWGLVCNEAFQCATPCVVSPFVGAGDDLINRGINGDVVPLNINDWVNCVVPLCTEEAIWTRYSQNALTTIRTRSIEGAVNAFRNAVEHLRKSARCDVS